MSKSIVRESSCESTLDPTYSLNIKQTLKNDQSEIATLSFTPPGVQLHVRLERFVPADIEFRYPQPGRAGPFDHVFPHIVLRRATWPWERHADAEKTAPWLALLLFKVAPEIHSGTVKDLYTLTSSETLGYQGPTCDTQWEAETTPCRYIDVPWSKFLELAPKPRQMRLLSHVQTVSTQGKADHHTARGPAARSAVVICHQAVPAADTYVVHLVSLEGMAPVLLGTSPGLERKYVRLLSLDHWTFTCGAGTHSFVHECGAVPGGPLRVEGAGGPHDEGYVIYGTEAAPQLYRGPLAPGPCTRTFDPRAFPLADARGAMCWRAQSTVISYAAAWELGRLLAIRDKELGLSLHRWREEEKRRAKRNATTSDDPSQLRLLRGAIDKLSRLRLLHGIPLHYILPDPDVLPPENIRFFHLDLDWVDALVDGAVASSRHTAAERILDAAPHGLLAALKATSLFDPPAPSKPAKTPPPAPFSGTPVTGFLLRSRTVTLWPTLEIEVTADKAGPQQPTILRMEHLAPDLLLCMVEGVLKRVNLHLPREAFHFECKPAYQHDPDSLFKLSDSKSFAVETAADPQCVIFEEKS